MSDPAEEIISELMTGANEKWKRQTGLTWKPFFVHALFFFVEWLAVNQPEPTREFLRALIELHRPDHDRESYARARRLLAVRQSELIDALDDKQPQTH